MQDGSGQADRENPGEVSQVIGRIGGDEFISCSVGMTQEELEEQIRQIHILCDRFNEKSGKPYFVEISAGIAVGRVRNMEDWAELSGRADAQLYEAKKARRDFVLRQV